jgi:hypothetical protein
MNNKLLQFLSQGILSDYRQYILQDSNLYCAPVHVIRLKMLVLVYVLLCVTKRYGCWKKERERNAWHLESQDTVLSWLLQPKCFMHIFIQYT